MISPGSIRITFDILNLVAEIDEFKGAWQCHALTPAEKQQTMQVLALGESTGASLRMEGAAISDHEALLLTQAPSAATAEGRFTAGYASVATDLFRNSAHTPFSVAAINQLHNDLRQYHSRGSSPIVVRGQVPAGKLSAQHGRQKADMPALPAAVTSDSLVAWTNAELEERTVHPLLVIAMFNAVFLAIDRYKEDNRVMSRLLTAYLLLRCGYHYIPYASLDILIEQNHDVYYHAMRQSAASLATEEVNWQPCIILLLKVLQQHKHKLEQKMLRESARQNRLPEISQHLLELIRTRGRITISEATAVTRISRSKVQKHLDDMVAEYQLQKHATTKAMWYSLNQ